MRITILVLSISFISVIDSNSQTIRINAGGIQRVYGNEIWEADQYYLNGTINSTAASISNTEKDELYQTERFANDLAYEIPVPAPGKFIVTLHFAEIFWTAEGERIFDVDIEDGQGILTNYDIVKVAGGAKTAITETFIVNVTDGFLTIDFTRIVDQAKVSAIQLTACEDPVINSFVASQPTVCEGSSTTLVVDGSIGSATWYLYTESCGGTLIASNTTGIFEVSPSANTTYYLRGEGGCSAPGPCSSVNVQVKTVVALATLEGNTLIATPIGATYQWINCNGNLNIEGKTERIFTPEESGSYGVKVTENGCSSNSPCVDFVIVGLPEGASNQVMVYPNPARSRVHVRFPEFAEKYYIQISDAQGRPVLNTFAIAISEFDLNIEPLARGVYFIHVQSEKITKTVKLIVN